MKITGIKGIAIAIAISPNTVLAQLFSQTTVTYNCVEPQGCPSVCGYRSYDWRCPSGNICICECTLQAEAINVGVGICTTTETSICFSSEVTVNTLKDNQNGITETKKMSEIEVGDYVLTGNGNYEMVYSIDHRHPTKLTKFVQIDYSDEHPPLELTPYHMIFLEGEPDPIPAGRVQVGDKLQSIYSHDSSRSNDDNNVGTIVVSDISSVTREGLYNPLTADGTIVVNGGIIASTYAALDLGGSHKNDNSEWITIAEYKVMTYQQFFNAILKPYKYVCTNVSLELCKTDNERILLERIANKVYDGWLRVQDHPNNIQRIITLTFVVSIAQLMDLVMNRIIIALSVSSILFVAMMFLYSRFYYCNKQKCLDKQD